jgi:integrase
MAQATVLTDTESRRVFRIIETTRHAERNRLAFALSIYAGLRVGEIAPGRRRGDLPARHRDHRGGRSVAHAAQCTARPRAQRGEVIPLVTKAFYRDRGEPRGSSVAIASSPTSVNLLQQTPRDKVLGDVLVSNSRVVRLIEFKQLALY